MTAPANDAFADAAALAGQRGKTTGDTTDATVEVGEPDPVAGWDPSPSVWFTWTAPTSEEYVFAVESHEDFDAYLDVFTGPDLDSLTPVDVESSTVTTGLEPDAAHLTEAVVFTAGEGVTYSLRVIGGDATYTGQFRLLWQDIASSWSPWITPDPTLVTCPTTPVMAYLRASGEIYRELYNDPDGLPLLNSADWTNLWADAAADDPLFLGYGAPYSIGWSLYSFVNHDGDLGLGTYREKAQGGLAAYLASVYGFDVTTYPAWKPSGFPTGQETTTPDGDLVDWAPDPAVLLPGGEVSTSVMAQNDTGAFGGPFVRRSVYDYSGDGHVTTVDQATGTATVTLEGDVYVRDPGETFHVETTGTSGPSTYTHADVEGFTGEYLGAVALTAGYAAPVTDVQDIDATVDLSTKVLDTGSHKYVNVMTKLTSPLPPPNLYGADIHQVAVHLAPRFTLKLRLQLPDYRVFIWGGTHENVRRHPVDEVRQWPPTRARGHSARSIGTYP